MPIVWAKFRTHDEAKGAIARLEYAGFEENSIDRLQGVDGRWSIGVYVDEQDAPHVRATMCDPNAPTRTNLLNSVMIFAAAALAGIVVSHRWR